MGRGIAASRSWRRPFHVLVIAASAAAASGTAAAEVRVGRESGGEYRVGVMSWWDIPFRSIVRQRYDFSCGSAAIATMLTYHYGRPTGEREVFAQMWQSGDQTRIREVGFSMLEMKNYLDSVGYRTEGVRLTISELAQVRRPVIVLLDLNGFKHFVVVKGIGRGRVLVGDSVLGLTQYELDDFGAMWNNVALAVLNPPSRERPLFNLAGDWNPWSTAPIEDGSASLAAATGDLTTHLPPTYQLTPEFLLDIRVGP